MNEPIHFDCELCTFIVDMRILVDEQDAEGHIGVAGKIEDIANGLEELHKAGEI